MAELKDQKAEEKPVDEVVVGAVDVPAESITPEEEKRLTRKIDCVVLPTVSLPLTGEYHDRKLNDVADVFGILFTMYRRPFSPNTSIAKGMLDIDKQSLSYASVFGLIEDLNLHGTQYSWCSSIFYFGRPRLNRDV